MPVTVAQAVPGVDVLTSDVEIPGLGHLPINAFVLHGAEPVLVDTGSVIQREEFSTALRVRDRRRRPAVDLAHPHRLRPHRSARRAARGEPGPAGDHHVPRRRHHGPVRSAADGPGELREPGESIVLGDRTLTAVKPPAFDNPITVGFHDDRTGALFSSDCFGALLGALPDRATDLSEAELRDGQMAWTAIDSSWLHKVDPTVFARDLDRIRGIEPTAVLSSHLAPAPGAMLDRLLDALAAVPASTPWAAPDQAMLEAMLAQMMTGSPG